MTKHWNDYDIGSQLSCHACSRNSALVLPCFGHGSHCWHVASHVLKCVATIVKHRAFWWSHSASVGCHCPPTSGKSVRISESVESMRTHKLVANCEVSHCYFLDTSIYPFGSDNYLKPWANWLDNHRITFLKYGSAMSHKNYFQTFSLKFKRTCSTNTKHFDMINKGSPLVIHNEWISRNAFTSMDDNPTPKSINQNLRTQELTSVCTWRSWKDTRGIWGKTLEPSRWKSVNQIPAFVQPNPHPDSMGDAYGKQWGHSQPKPCLDTA